MIPIAPSDHLELVAGTGRLVVEPDEPYDDAVCKFLNELSVKLMETGRLHADVLSFAFWCRRGNLQQLKLAFDKSHARLGLGAVFHIAPSNVPVNFAFSYVFGLLSGNSNLVRIPSKDFPQVSVICEALSDLFREDRYSRIFQKSSFVRYPRNDEITSRFSKLSHARVIWGGDATVRHIKSLPSMERSVDIAFADRYSMCVIDAPSVNELSDKDIGALANHFFNDTYLMDQNACSSPHLIVWQGSGKTDAKFRFWGAVSDCARSKYRIEYVHAVDKYTQFCENVLEGEERCELRIENEWVYRVQVERLTGRTEHLKGKFGLFYEYDVDSIFESQVMKTIVNTKFQTVTYFGVDKGRLLALVRDNHLLGVDRIVPIGRALDIGVYWDGFDIVRSLSRIIFVQ